jgi:hypothetical protein
MDVTEASFVSGNSLNGSSGESIIFSKPFFYVSLSIFT